MHHGVSKSEAMAGLEALQAAMNAHFEEHADRAHVGLRVLPGVKELLAALQLG